MGVKYTHEFISEKSNNYIVDIHDSLFVGSETEVRALGGGFRIQYNSESDDINEPIKASSCTFNMLIEDSTMETYIESLVDRAYGDIHLVITKNTDTYWAGTINTALIKLEHASYPYAIEFNAVDGLGELQNYKFDSDNMTLLSQGNRFKLTQYFAELLNVAGVTDFLGTSNLFTTASPLYETQTVAANDVFATTYLYTSAFTDQNGNYNLNFSQVLRQILIGFNSRIMLANGRFKIIDNRFYDYYTTFKEFTYNSTGVQQSTATFDNSVAYGSDRIFLADPIIEFDPGLKFVQAKQVADFDIRIDPTEDLNLVFGSSGSTLYTVRRDPVLGVDASAIGFSTLVGGTNKKLRLEFTINNNGIDPKKIKYINVVIQVTDGLNSKRLSNTYNSFTTINPTTKNPDPYVWVTPSLTEGINILFAQGKNGKYVIDFPDLPYTNCNIEYLAFMLMGDYDIVRTGNIFNTSYNITNIDCTNLVTGMVVQDYDVAGRIQLSPPVTLTTVTPANKLAVMNTLYTNAAGFRNIGFLLPANDIVSGDEDLISLEITSFSYLPDGVNVDNEGYIYTSTNDDVFTERYEIDPVYYGDGFNIQNKNTLYVDTGFGLVPSSAWTIKPTLEVQNSAALLQKLTQSVLWHQYKGLKRYNGTIFTTGYEPYQAIIKSTEKLIYIGGEFVGSMDEWSGSWAVWQYRPDAYVSTTRGNGTKASNVDITKDIYPKVNIAVLDNNLKLIADVIGSMGGSLAMFRQAVMDAEKIALDYVGSDPQFAFQTSGATAVVTNAKDTDIIVTNENGKFWKVVDGVAQEQFQVLQVSPQVANRVYAGPTSGASANPTFRALVAADLPSGLIASVGTIDSVSPKVANGAQISGTALIMQTADGTYPGLISTAAQTIVGVKTMRAEPGTTSNTNYITLETNRNASGGAGIVGGYYLRGGTNDTAIFGVNSNATYLSLVKGSTSYAIYDFSNGVFINKGFSGATIPSVASITRMANPGAFEFLAAASAITSLQQVTSTPVAYCNSALSGGGVQGDLIISARGTNGKQIGFAVPGAASATLAVAVKITASGLDITDAYDIVIGSTTGTKIGQSGSKIGLFGVTPVVRPTALTTQLTTITATAPGTPDYTIQDLTQTTPYGFVTSDEAQSFLKVVANLQIRVAELETKLQALGALT